MLKMNTEDVRYWAQKVSNNAHPVEEIVGIAQCQILAELAIGLDELNRNLAKIANPVMVVEESPWVTFDTRYGGVTIDRTVVASVRDLLLPSSPPTMCEVISRTGSAFAVIGSRKDVCEKLRIPYETVSC